MPKISSNNHVLIPKLVPIDNLIVNKNFMRMKFTKLLFKTCALTFFTFMLGINISEAQTWDAPTLTGSTLTTGTTYYVYNVGSNGYLTRGGWWQTFAVVSAHPEFNASNEVIKWTATNTSGSVWTFQYNLNGNNEAGKFLKSTSPTDGSVFTDGTGDDTWNVVQTDATNNIYSIQVVSTYGGYVADQYFGSSSATESTNMGVANTARYNRASGDSYTQWKFATQADLDLYKARVLLDKYMNIAKTKGGIDISSYIATYNAGVTVDINTAAATLLTTIGRTDVTSSIANHSFEDLFTDWTNTDFATQNNDPGQGWIKDGTYYAEKYTWTDWDNAYNLSASTITQTVTGLSSGLYELVVKGHAIQQAGSNPLNTGAFITAGSQSTEVDAVKDSFSISNIVVAGSTLTIGYSLIDPIACNWTGFDNFRLYYYGAIVTPTLTASKSSLFFDDVYTSDVFTVSGLNLINPVTLTAPTGITLSTYSIPANPSDVSVTVTYNGSAVVDGTITLTSGTNVVNISVKTSSNAGCFTPLYSSGNLIPDPYLNSLIGFSSSSWGTRNIVTSPDSVYCGSRSAKIAGSLDVDFPVLSPNTHYKMKAMVLTIGGKFRIGIENLGAGVANIDSVFDTNGKWKAQTVEFTTGSTEVTSTKCWFNNHELTGTTGYIDNWEFYSVGIVTQIAVTGTGGDTTVSIDKTLQMVASVLPADAVDKTFTWSIVNGTGTATLSNTGLLTPVSLGTVTVIATANDGSGTVDSLLVTITDPIVLVTAINLEGTDLVTTITTNHGMLQVSATVLPFDATNKSLDYTIINGTGEATISNTGLVTALRNGTVTAIATAKDGSHVSDSLVITISGQIDVLVSSIVVTGADLATTITTLGGTLQVSATVLPVDAVNQSVDWSLENGTGEATISATGLVTAVKDGTVTAIATAKDSSNVSGSLVITISGQTQTILVSSITVTGANNDTTITTKAGTLQMLADVLPTDASNDTVVWSVTHGTGEATISATGLLTAAEDGTVTVKATATDGSAVSGSIVITISNQEDPIISVSDKDLSDVSIYPNPVEAEITISGNTSFRSIEIYNVDGTLINRLDNVASTSSINVSELTSGVYIIRLTTANECATKRFVKK
jgi:uncharacterized protein YjdB